MEAKSAGKVELMTRLGNINALPVVVSVKEPEAPPAPPVTQLVAIRIYASRNEINATERLPLRARGKFSNGREGELKNVR